MAAPIAIKTPCARVDERFSPNRRAPPPTVTGTTYAGTAFISLMIYFSVHRQGNMVECFLLHPKSEFET